MAAVSPSINTPKFGGGNFCSLWFNGTTICAKLGKNSQKTLKKTNKEQSLATFVENFKFSIALVIGVKGIFPLSRLYHTTKVNK